MTGLRTAKVLMTGLCLAGAVPFIAHALMAHVSAAQLNNEPWRPQGGQLGISGAGREAVLLEQITGTQPDHIVRLPDGIGIVTRADNTGRVGVITTEAGDFILPQRAGAFRNFGEFTGGGFDFFGTLQPRRRSFGPRVITSGQQVDEWTFLVSNFPYWMSQPDPAGRPQLPYSGTPWDGRFDGQGGTQGDPGAQQQPAPVPDTEPARRG